MTTRKSHVFYAVLIALSSVVVGMVIASRLDISSRSFAGMVNVPATNSAPLTGTLDASTFRTIAREASPSVVTIQITGTRPGRSLSDLFSFGGNPDQFGGGGGGARNRRQQPPPEETIQGAGSGFIIDKNGFILTNNHVVEDAKTIEVHLSSMKDLDYGLPAKVIARDELSDTALLQIIDLPKEPLIEAKFGDSSQIAPGDWVMAIGNPFEQSNTVTVGVVSAVGRQITGAAAGRSEEMIQTDAAINQGNSGGPLLNIRGEVIGINTMIISDQTGGNLGIGFAIPINVVRDLLPMLRTGKVTRGRIALSLDVRPISRDLAESLGLPNTAGAIVAKVTAGGPAAVAGIKVEDVIVEFNGKAVPDNNELVNMVMRTAPGTTVPVKLYRDKKPLTVNVKVAELDLAAEQSEQTQAAPARARPNRSEPKDTGGFGMTIDAITPDLARQYQVPTGQTGAVVIAVAPASAASQAGVQEGDVIVSIDGQAVSTLDQVSAALDAVPAGRTVRLIVSSAGERQLRLVRKR